MRGVLFVGSGRVRVVFTNLKDNNSFVKAIEGQIVEIVKEAFNKRGGPYHPSEALSVDGASNSLLSVARGSCRFKYGYKQMIDVDQKPINDKSLWTESWLYVHRWRSQELFLQWVPSFNGL